MNPVGFVMKPYVPRPLSDARSVSVAATSWKRARVPKGPGTLAPRKSANVFRVSVGMG